MGDQASPGPFERERGPLDLQSDLIQEAVRSSFGGNGIIAPAGAAAGVAGAAAGGSGLMAFPGAQFMTMSGLPIAGGGSSASTAATAAINPWALLITAGFMVYALVGRSNPVDRRTEGYSFQFDENPTDPNDPIVLAYGRPAWVPSTLFRYLTPENLNQLSPAEGQRFVTCMSLGAGPLDGRDLMLWLDDRKMWDKFDDDVAESNRTLHAIDEGDKRVFAFPVANIQPGSVSLYSDGALISAQQNGGEITEVTTTQVTAQRADAETFTVDNDSGIGQTARYGCYPPVDGIDIHDITMKVTVKPFRGGNRKSVLIGGNPERGYYSGGTRINQGSSATFTETNGDTGNIRLGKDDDGKRYFYVNATENGSEISHFTLTYKVKPTIKLENRDGTWVAVFSDAQTGTITGKWNTSELGDDIKVHFRNGAQDQDPLPVDGVREASVIGEELTQGTARTYTTPADADDVELVIESGPAGFYDAAIAGQNAGEYRPTHRSIQIKVREASAANQAATKNDPSTGWVTLGHPNSEGGIESNRIKLQSSSEGNVGTARWFFSIADLLAAKQGNNAELTTGNNLPKHTSYEIQVVALDKANWDGVEEVDRIKSELFLAAAQDVRRIKMSLPYHATLTVEISDLEEIQREPRFRVQCAARRVWVPDSGAAYDSDTGRLESGTWQWSRNPVWCACDIITNPIFGGGEWYDWNNIDATLVESAADFCDETIGGETRSELDMVYRDRRTMWEHVAQACAGARILPTMSGGTWRFLIDQDGSSVMTLTEDDFQYQAIRLQLPGVEDIPTDIEAGFTDEEQDFETDTELRSRDGEPAQRVVRRIDLTGVRRRSQVARAADLALRQFNLQRRVIRLAAASWRLMVLEAGDLVTLTATTTNDSAATYRVNSIGWGPDFLPAVELAEHDPNVYTSSFNPIRIVPSRPPASPPSGDKTDTQKPEPKPYIHLNGNAEAKLRKFVATRVLEHA